MQARLPSGSASTVKDGAAESSTMDPPAATAAAIRSPATCFRDSLVPGGRLFVDIPVPPPAAGHEAMRYWRRGSYLWTLQTIHIEYDPATTQTTRFLRYDKWQDGTLRMTELQTFRLQHWTSHEFADLLAEAGFTHILVTADYQDARTPRAGNGVWTFHATAHTRSDGGPHPHFEQTASVSQSASRTLLPSPMTRGDEHEGRGQG